MREQPLVAPLSERGFAVPSASRARRPDPLSARKELAVAKNKRGNGEGSIS
jgi:hypothetical protein